jgi:hypothetical protein
MKAVHKSASEAAEEQPGENREVHGDPITPRIGFVDLCFHCFC